MTDKFSRKTSWKMATSIGWRKPNQKKNIRTKIEVNFSDLHIILVLHRSPHTRQTSTRFSLFCLSFALTLKYNSNWESTTTIQSNMECRRLMSQYFLYSREYLISRNIAKKNRIWFYNKVTL